MLPVSKIRGILFWVPVRMCLQQTFKFAIIFELLGLELIFHRYIACGKSFSNIPKYIKLTLTYDLLLKMNK